MELDRKVSHYPITETNITNPLTFKPTSYKEMDDWLNAFSTQAWTALLGAYTCGGHRNVVEYMRTKYATNLTAWKDKDLRHFWNSRHWGDFKTKYDRPQAA